MDNLFTRERLPAFASPSTMSEDSPRRSCFSRARERSDSQTFSLGVGSGFGFASNAVAPDMVEEVGCQGKGGGCSVMVV